MNGFIRISTGLTWIITLVTLTACGGGGSGESSPDTVQTGSIQALPVKGLFYETETLSGLTDAEGRFRFKAGENISFRLGQTQLGGAEAKTEISPAELSSFEPVTDESVLINLLYSPMVNSLDMFLNINTLLMSLDKDGNPDNGIDLGDAHTVLDNLGEELDITFKAKDFSASEKLVELIDSLRARKPKDLEFVASHLYKALGLQVEAKRTLGLQAASNGIQGETSTSRYNASGELESETVSMGEQQVVLSYEYDEEKRLKRVTNRYTGDVKSFSYSRGQLANVRIESEASGIVYQEVRQYDKDGSLKRLETDQDGDGKPDKVSVFDRSVDREQVSVSKREQDKTVESTKVTEYRGDLVEKMSEDYDNDGQMDLQMLYTYDEKNRVVSRKIISHDASIESSISYFEYDDQDRLIHYSSDNDQDGQVDYIEEYAYDYQDNRILFRRDQEADGIWNYSAFYRFDDQGNRIEINEDTDGNGIIDQHWKATLEQINVESGWSKIVAGF